MKQLITVLIVALMSTHQLTYGQSSAKEQKTVLLPSYIESVGRIAYVWGWPMVNLHNRQKMFEQVPIQGFLGGVMPVAPINKLTIFPDYGTPDQKDVAHPNQDVIYGFGITDLDKSPVVIQVPDFGERFWMYELADQRTDSYCQVGKMYGTQPGHYLVVGPTWKGTKPDGITDIFVSPTSVSVVIPRIFMDDTKEDRSDVQKYINQVSMYPLSEYDGTMKVINWKSLPSIPEPNKSAAEKKWVNPDTFFFTLAKVMDEVAPQQGEESLYAMIQQVLEQAQKNPEQMKILTATAQKMEKELMDSLFYFNNVGVEVENYWTRPFNNAAFGYDFLTRAAIAKSNIFTNHFRESAYFYQYRDGNGDRLDCATTDGYTITFPASELPPVDGFWSLTLYDENHFFHHNEIKRYSLGTKNRSLKYNKDGSLTLYIQNKRPQEKNVTNWLPAPKGKFCVTIRAYWPQQSVIDGNWIAPKVIKSN